MADSIDFDINITDRLRVAPTKIVDGVERSNVIEAVVVVCTAKLKDDEGNVLDTVSSDPWQTLSLDNVTDFVEYEDLQGLPQRAIDELTAYGESQREVLTQQLNARKNMSVEKTAPWSGSNSE